jgi:hypothetical protein
MLACAGHISATQINPCPEQGFVSPSNQIPTEKAVERRFCLPALSLLQAGVNSPRRIDPGGTFGQTPAVLLATAIPTLVARVAARAIRSASSPRSARIRRFIAARTTQRATATPAGKSHDTRRGSHRPYSPCRHGPTRTRHPFDQ